jgi:hypothetical protein
MKRQTLIKLTYTMYLSIFLLIGLCIEQALSLFLTAKFLGQHDYTFTAILMQVIYLSFLVSSSMLYAHRAIALGPIESEDDAEIERLHRNPAYTRREIRNFADERSTEA